MLELFSTETSVVVGLELSDDEGKLLRTAVSLARRTGARLVLVHAVQSVSSYAAFGEGTSLSYAEFEREAFQDELIAAEQKLYALRDRMPPELFIDLRVCRDYPEDALEAVAEEVEASLILCGLRPPEHKSWLSSMNTALSLMGSSRFPVMALPLGTELDFVSPEHNILVADNLEREGLAALQAALGLCKSISYKHLFHLHVKKTSYREINSIVDKIKTAMSSGQVPYNASFEAEDYLGKLRTELRDLLQQRLSLADEDFARGLHWTPKVRFGEVAEELHRTAKECQADLMIFGKHHFLKAKKLFNGEGFGKIPYEAMIDPLRASIVVPEVYVAS